MAKIEEKSKELKERIKKTKHKSCLYEMENGENGDQDILVNNIEREVLSYEEIEEDIKFDGNDQGVAEIDISDESVIPEELEMEEEHIFEIQECIECEEN